MSERNALNPEDIEDGSPMDPSPSSSSSSSSRGGAFPKTRAALKETSAKVLGDNGWKTGLILLTNFTAIVFLAYITISMRGGFISGDIGVASAMGAAFALVYFGFGYFFEPIQVDPFHTIIQMTLFDEPVGRGILRILIQFAGWIVGALMAHIQIGYDRYESAAVIPSGNFTTFQSWMIEAMLGVVVYILYMGFSAVAKKREISLPIASLFVGITVYASQGLAYPISGGSLNVFHWLCTNIIGSLRNSNLYWPGDCYIYILAPLFSAVVAAFIFILYKHMHTMAMNPAAYKQL